VVAARWEELRLAMDRAKTTPADDERFRELSHALKALTDEMWLTGPHLPPSARSAERWPDHVPGLTDVRGFLPGDPQRLWCRDWREAAGW